MKKNAFLICLLTAAIFSFNAKAQMFYSSAYDKGVQKSGTEADYQSPSVERDPDTDSIPQPIKERLLNNALRVLAKPDEVYCYGISRKNPKNKTETINGYALNGECGTLNDEGLKAVQEKFFNPASFDMATPKISQACVVKPKLLLRFRRGIDFVDAVLSGEKCPGIVYLYAGETKEFYARPMHEWLDTFILAVLNDLTPIDSENPKNKELFLRKKKTDAAETKQENTGTEAAPAAPKTWGRRFN